MLNKTKKVAFLTTGLAGALVVSSAVGIALSSCTTTDTSSSNKPNKFTYSIDWTDQNQLKQLTIDEQGLVYSSADKSEIITVAPNTAATSFVIPASVKYITGYNEITKNSSGVVTSSTSKGAFQDQTSLISITFASNDTLISIGDSSFKGCTYLSTITLPTSTTVVYNNAFENCTNLRNIGLTNVTYVGSSAFKNAIANGADVSIDLSSATYIGDNAFENSTSLSNVDLSKNTALTYIGKSAFKGALVSGDSATTIDLSKAAVLKTISDSAFQNCTNLGTVVLPSTSVLTTIGANAFNGASSLSQVGSTAGTFSAPSSLGNYAATSGDSSYVTSGIGKYAFTGTKITTIDLSALTVATPFTNATFKNMTSLASVNFGSSSKITTIPYSLFEGDTALTTLTLPASITTINDGANNDSNSSENVDQKSPFYNSGLVTIDMTNITSYAIGTRTTLQKTIDLTTMLPDSLFANCTNLTTVQLKTGTVGIGTSTFNGASSLVTVKEGALSSTETNGEGFLIPSTLEWTSYYAFKGTGIKTVAFANTSADASNKLWYLGQGTFEGTTALTTVNLSNADKTTSHTIPAGDTGTGSNDETGNGLFAISTSLFKDSTSLTSVTLPSSVTKIFREAFVGNTALTSVNFGELLSLSIIQTENFNSTKLTNIDFSKITDTSTINSLSASFTGSSYNIFNNLPNDATVSFPAAMVLNGGLTTTGLTTVSSSNTAVVRPNINYPNGLDITTSTINGYTAIGASGSSATYTLNRMLEYVSEDFNLATSTNGQGIKEYYSKTFFGNTKLKKLTLSASQLYTSTQAGSSTTYAEQPTLFIHHYGGNSVSGSTSYYLNKFIPFGNNSSLTDLVFSGFTLNDNPNWPEATAKAKDMSNSLYRTTEVTWAQVSTIINKFASNDTATLTKWPTSFNNNIDDTSNINSDSVATGTAETDSSGYTVKFTNSKAADAATWEAFSVKVNKNIASGQVSSNKFIHNGVTWTLNVESGGAITLTGTNINVYRATTPNNNTRNKNPYQVCFSENDGTPSRITVTLEIYTPSSNS